MPRCAKMCQDNPRSQLLTFDRLADGHPLGRPGSLLWSLQPAKKLRCLMRGSNQHIWTLGISAPKKWNAPKKKVWIYNLFQKKWIRFWSTQKRMCQTFSKLNTQKPQPSQKTCSYIYIYYIYIDIIYIDIIYMHMYICTCVYIIYIINK